MKKTFSCEACNKDFYLQWRLEKHRKVHEETTKLCRFYANKKICPFERVGCKFRHDEANNEKSSNVEEMEAMANDEEHEKEKEQSEDILDELNETQCHLCMVNLPTRDDLIDHYELDHIEFYTLMTSRSTTT